MVIQLPYKGPHTNIPVRIGFQRGEPGQCPCPLETIIESHSVWICLSLKTLCD